VAHEGAPHAFVMSETRPLGDLDEAADPLGFPAAAASHSASVGYGWAAVKDAGNGALTDCCG
jgi:hypothetical protein